MFLINRTPGGFIALANVVVYGVIGLEIWMWTVASVAAVAGVLVFIALCAVLICRSVVHLMDDDAPQIPKPTATPDPQPAASPSRSAAPRVGRLAGV